MSALPNRSPHREELPLTTRTICCLAAIGWPPPPLRRSGLQICPSGADAGWPDRRWVVSSGLAASRPSSVAGVATDVTRPPPHGGRAAVRRNLALLGGPGLINLARPGATARRLDVAIAQFAAGSVSTSTEVLSGIAGLADGNAATSPCIPTGPIAWRQLPRQHGGTPSPSQVGGPPLPSTRCLPLRTAGSASPGGTAGR